MAWPEGQGRLPDAALKGGAFPTPQKACAAAMGHPHGLGSGNMHESIGPSWADGLGSLTCPCKPSPRLIRQMMRAATASPPCPCPVLRGRHLHALVVPWGHHRGPASLETLLSHWPLASSGDGESQVPHSASLSIPVVCGEDDQCLSEQPQVPHSLHQGPHSRIQLHQGVPKWSTA